MEEPTSFAPQWVLRSDAVRNTVEPAAANVAGYNSATVTGVGSIARELM
jgi:hypothetical protein